MDSLNAATEPITMPYSISNDFAVKSIVAISYAFGRCTITGNGLIKV